MPLAAAARRADHSAFLSALPHGELSDGVEPGHSLGKDFLSCRADSDELLAPLGARTRVKATQFLALPGDEALGASAPQSSEFAKLQVHEAGILPHLGENWGILKAVKTTVLVTGGLCSKLFGIGLMGYLAFQSIQANVQRSKQQDSRRS
eukprot:TRINITY_DN65445_c0_g1_i1.p1 TRINITY_DN65445_c0_g1~~TRINITY_DN65445_c0_g1_i1.p1  ORF type:complete len:163 (+),score=22.82 TRINITY_DN65445_c0_g1_i1:41-490(+)